MATSLVTADVRVFFCFFFQCDEREHEKYLYFPRLIYINYELFFLFLENLNLFRYIDDNFSTDIRSSVCNYTE